MVTDAWGKLPPTLLLCTPWLHCNCLQVLRGAGSASTRSARHRHTSCYHRGVHPPITGPSRNKRAILPATAPLGTEACL